MRFKSLVPPDLYNIGMVRFVTIISAISLHKKTDHASDNSAENTILSDKGVASDVRCISFFFCKGNFGIK
jgi:hypothetical protein